MSDQFDFLANLTEEHIDVLLPQEMHLMKGGGGRCRSRSRSWSWTWSRTNRCHRGHWKRRCRRRRC